MNKHPYIVAAAAAALSISGLTWAQNTTADQQQQSNPTAGQRIENAADKTGDAIKSGAEKTGDAIHSGYEKTKDAVGLNKDASAKQTEHAADVQKILAQVAEASVTKGGLDDMAERFVDADRNRLGQNQDALKNNQALDGRVAQFEKDWKDKYGHEFKVSYPDKAYDQSFAMITEGEEAGARTASGKVNADTNTQTPPDQVNASNKEGVDKPGVNTNGQTDADKNLNDKGRNMATVHIAASHGLPALDVPMIHEAGGWKIDIPDSVDAAKLRDNVQTALTKVDENKAQWPADETEAQRAVTHQVLAAIFDKTADSSAAPAGAQLPADQGTSPTAAPAAK